MINGYVAFNKLNEEEKEFLITNLKHLYLETDLSRDEIIKQLDISMSFYKKLLKDCSLKRDTKHNYRVMCRINKLKRGYENPFQSEMVKNKIKQTNLQKYGVEYSSQSDNWKKQIKEININKTQEDWNIRTDKIKQTKLEKYGDENYVNIEKRRQTNLKKYGCQNALNNQDVISKAKQTRLKLYNDENYNNSKKRIQTNLERYGVEYPLQNENIKEKSKQTTLKHFGVNYSLSSKKVRLKGDITKLQKYGNKNYTNNEQMKITKFFKYGNPYFTNHEKQEKTMIEKYGVCCGFQLDKCINNNGITISKINKKFALLLKENNIEYEQEFHILSKSFDFKVDNILIEINPTYTHNSTEGPCFKNHKCIPKDKFYHQNKSKLAQEHGYRCIHIWDWDDRNKIVNLLLPKQKIYARNCKIKEVSKKECDEFLNLYHLQNTCRGQSIKLGLYYNNQLVQIMTFGKSRYNKTYEWELLRLCSHKDYMIVGGAERLFKHFIIKYEPNTIISYCDNSKFNGEIYSKLGFIKSKEASPSCNWSKGTHKITQNLLNQQGADRLIGTCDGKGTSNRDIMIREGWLEVYDCGQQLWIWNI